MPSKRQVAANKRNSRRNADQMKRMRMIAQARRHGPKIPTSVLRALAAMGLPNDPQAYAAKLNELMASG